MSSAWEDSSLKWMHAALKYAEEALKDSEVPVGCVFVYDDQVIAAGRNEVNATKNATRHAEFVALDRLQSWCVDNCRDLAHVLSECCLYVTVEPCIMCTDALRSTLPCAPKLVVYGARNDRFGGCGSVLSAHTAVPRRRSPDGQNGLTPELRCQSGCCADEAVALLKQFYQQENPNAPSDLKKMKQSSVQTTN